MAIGRYFRGLSAYDLLGNLLPGVIGLLVILGGSPDPPLPRTVSEIALYAAFAFIVGSVIQAYASRAVGSPQSFVRTMESAEVVPTLQYEATDDQDGSSSARDKADRTVGEVPSESEKRDGGKLYWLVYPLVGPIYCWFSSPEWGEKLDDAILVNRIWEHIIDTHEIPFETDEYGVLYHLMSSKIDGTRSPSRALRMQAIRNFNRGMWIAAWGLFIGVSIEIGVAQLQAYALGGSVPVVPSFTTHWTHLWSLWLLAIIGTVMFWRLYRSSEEDYIEYLFTDYAIAITEREHEFTFAPESLDISLKHVQTDREDNENGECRREPDTAPDDQSGDSSLDPDE